VPSIETNFVNIFIACRPAYQHRIAATLAAAEVNISSAFDIMEQLIFCSKFEIFDFFFFCKS
jgi:hypothetical protein